MYGFRSRKYNATFIQRKTNIQLAEIISFNKQVHAIHSSKLFLC